MASRSFGILVFPFRGGTYSGNFIAKCTSWMSSSMPSASSISSKRAYRSSSSSSISMVTSLPFSSIESLPNRGFLGDMRIGPAICLSFLGLGVRGDFGISGVTQVSLGTSCTVGFYAASLVVLSTEPKPLLVVIILFELSVGIRKLRGSNLARHSTLCALINCSNLK